MKSTLKALWHGIKALFTAVVEWVATLFERHQGGRQGPLPLPPCLWQRHPVEQQRQKSRVDHGNSIRTVHRGLAPTANKCRPYGVQIEWRKIETRGLAPTAKMCRPKGAQIEWRESRPLGSRPRLISAAPTGLR